MFSWNRDMLDWDIFLAVFFKQEKRTLLPLRNAYFVSVLTAGVVPCPKARIKFCLTTLTLGKPRETQSLL